MTDIYFGVDNLPKGKRYPSMKEAADKRQVRYFGLHKIDKIVLEHAAKLKKKQKNRIKLMMKHIEFTAKLKKLKNELAKETIVAKKNAIDKKIVNFNSKLKDVIEDLKEFQKITIKPVAKKNIELSMDGLAQFDREKLKRNLESINRLQI
jgi:esterase/lipase